MRKKKSKKRVTARTDTSAKQVRKNNRAKAVAKKKPRSKAPKTMNSGTMTTQQFWNMIRQLLRRRTIYWLPIVNVRNRAKIPYKGPNKRRKYSYICEGCGGEFAASECNVHHKIEAGSLTCAEDLPGFVTRLFCSEEDLALLCHKCHDKEHEK